MAVTSSSTALSTKSSSHHLLGPKSESSGQIALKKPAAATRAEDEVNKMLINVKALRHTVYSINGDEYTGGWKGFNKQGKGTYKWKASGEIYEGNWQDNKRNGFGTLIVPKTGGSYRMQYSGEWVNDRKEGQGSHFYSEEEFYEGQWKRGKRSGWGTMTYTDGNIYEGEWSGDKQCGHGVLKLTNGDRYEGEWSNGLKHGAGKFFYENKGQVYEGQWEKGVPRCGEMRNYDRTAPEAPSYVMPKLGLESPSEVLDKATEQFSDKPQEGGEVEKSDKKLMLKSKVSNGKGVDGNNKNKVE